MKKHLWVLLVLLAAAFTGQSQNAHLRIVSLINFPDTAKEGISYPVEMIMKNVGTAAYQGPVQVILKADSGSEIFYFNQSPNFILFPNDTVVLTAGNGSLGYNFTSQVYKAGNDVVVVWPYSTQTAVSWDTLYTDVVYIPLPLTTIIPVTDKSGLRIFPNPFNNIINIETADGTMVEEVRISDLFGREVYRKQFAIGSLYLPDMQKGLYILELNTADKRKVIFKLFRQ